MRRFFFDPASRRGDDVVLSEEESRHVVKVLRLKVGAELELLDGQGAIFNGRITNVGRQVIVRLEHVVDRESAAQRTVWVGQGILKGEKMDMVVQKSTELGVHRLTPLQLGRSQGRLSEMQGRKKLERWQRISLESCKQCRRLLPMQIDEPADYSSFLANEELAAKKNVRLLFWEEEKKLHLRDVSDLKDALSLTLILGPEGGLSREEVEAARSCGFQTVSLGEKILRAETAAVSSVAIVQYLLGNL